MFRNNCSLVTNFNQAEGLARRQKIGVKHQVFLRIILDCGSFPALFLISLFMERRFVYYSKAYSEPCQTSGAIYKNNGFQLFSQNAPF